MTDFETSGLHNSDNAEDRYFRLGNLIIDSGGNVKVDEQGNPDLTLDYLDMKPHSEPDECAGEQVKQKILALCNLKPGVSDVALYYGTMMITQELFGLNRRYPFFVLLLLGRHGSFKTMLSKRTISLLSNDRIQEVKFYNLSKNAALEEVLNDTEIFTILIDDIIPVNGYSQKKRYADVFDWVSRSGDRERFRGGALITAEKIPEEVVASAYDRIWEIKMPVLRDEDKTKWYSVLTDITNRDLAYFYVEYCRKLMMNYDRVMCDISKFWETFKLPENITRKTRIADHFEYIMLSEYLLKKYYLAQPEISIDSICMEGDLLIKRAEIQQNRILKMDMSSREIDIPYITYQVLMCQKSGIQLISNRQKYEREEVCNKALLEGDYVFVKPAILLEEINDYTNAAITLKKLSTGLEKEGILIPTGGNSKTVTEIKTGRHYKLNYKKLCAYQTEYEREHGELEEDSNLIIPVHHKNCSI